MHPLALAAQALVGELFDQRCARNFRCTVVEAHNRVASFHTDEAILLDHEAFHDICFSILKLMTPWCGKLNHLVSTAISDVMTCSRFSCARPPALSFPLTTPHDDGRSAAHVSRFLTFCALAVPGFTMQILDAKNMMCAADPGRGRYLTALARSWGRMSTKQVVE